MTKNESSELFDRKCALSLEILDMARGQLLMKLRFLDRALFELRIAMTETGEARTDGARLLISPDALLPRYAGDQTWALHCLLHCLLHNIFRHMFVSGEIYDEVWDMAADIAVERLIQELALDALRDDTKRPRREALLDRLCANIQSVTAERIYSELLDMPPEPEDEELIKELLHYDSHELWYMFERNGDNAQGGQKPQGGFRTKSGTDVLRGDGTRSPNDDISRELEQWVDIARQMQIELENFKSYGDTPSTMVQTLRALNREKYDYTAFLRKFAEQTEVMRVSPDEYDNVFYSYGMQLYGDMPLIEPLEYREDPRIRELVIAIDTSGSVAGDTVQRFMQKTFNILKSHETFERRFLLHIIQCDAAIQQDTVIRTQDDFDLWLCDMQLLGFGGTDFRPVFEYVDRLRSKGELSRMKGLIYFTDGVGEYPRTPTDYMTAFVFVQRDIMRDVTVPAWAIKILLENKDL